MTSKPCTQLYTLLLTSSLLIGCTATAPQDNTTQTSPNAAEQQRLESELLESKLNQQADNAFAELDGKAKPHSSPVMINTQQEAPQLQTTPSAVKNLKQEPSWVLTPPVDNNYVFGIGAAAINSTTAIASQIADEQAKVNLVANLRVEVSGRQSSREQLQGGIVSQSFNSEIQSTIKTTTYSGLKVIERYISSKDNTVYSLAALHRQTALNQLQQQISQIDQQLLAAKNNSPQTQALEQIRQALPAFKQLALRKQLNQQALDVSAGQHQFPLSPELQQYQNHIAGIIDQLRFNVLSNSDPLLKDYLIKLLTDQGMRVQQTKQADIHISYRIDWRHIQKDAQHYQLATATVHLKDSDGKILSSYIEKAKGVSSHQGIAKDKAQEKLAQQLSRSLGANLLQAID